MRSGDDVFDAVIRRHAAHFQRRVPGLRAIVNFRQNVAMNIDHVDRRGEKAAT
jgi:hypothetical protein